MSAATDAAQDAAEAVRDLNHATFRHEGYSYPSEVYDVIGALAEMASRSVQAVEQATAWLEAEQIARRLRHQDAVDAGTTGLAVMVALGSLIRAREDIARAGLSLRYCHGLLGPFGAVLDTPPPAPIGPTS